MVIRHGVIPWPLRRRLDGVGLLIERRARQARDIGDLGMRGAAGQILDLVTRTRTLGLLAGPAEWIAGSELRIASRGIDADADQRRVRVLTALLALSQVRRLDEPLMLLLRILADRWSYVGPDGIPRRLRLTHETIARLARARRPSVSTALARLERDGLLAREGHSFTLPLETLSEHQ